MDNIELNTLLKDLKDDLGKIKERLRAVEKEQRLIREDLLSGEAKIRMQKRILENQPNKINELRKKIDEEINIKI
jgi:predicted  nucleic acid-binding Zn-ribbon protein